MPKTKMLAIWHEAGNPLYGDRFRELSRHFDLSAVGPDHFQGIRFPAPPRDLPVRLFRAMFTRHWLTYLSPAILGRVIRSDAEILYVHEEPHSLTAFLCAVLRGRKRMYVESSVINPKGSFGGRNPFERYVYRRATAIFPKNNEVREMLAQRGAPRAKIGPTVGNGASLGTFHPIDKTQARATLTERYPALAEALAGTGLVVGYAGRIWRPKGLDTLAAVARMRAVKVVICGPSVDEPFERELADAGIVILPKLDAEDLRLFYSALDLFVLPSLSTPGWREQFGRVCLEAIYCGTPAIGSSVGGIPEVIGTANTFPPGDAQALARKLDALSDGAARAELVETEFAFAQGRYSWEGIAAQLQRLTTDGRAPIR